MMDILEDQQQQQQQQESTAFVRFTAKRSRGKTKKDDYGNYLSTIASIQYKYPFKLMVPQYASSNNCQWVYGINYGGGVVSGDEVALKIDVEEGCSALLTTQGSTKVYHTVDGKSSVQTLTGTIGSGAMLAIIQEPVVCYRDSKYKQIQNFHMQADSNLVFIDWITGGRVANGERWDFTSCSTANSVFLGPDLVFRDTLRLNNTETITVKDTMKHYNVTASCVVLGPDLSEVVNHIKDVVGRTQNIGDRPDPDFVISASHLQYEITNSTKKLSGVIFKCAGTEISQVYRKLDSLLEPLYPKLGGNPFDTKY